MIFHATDFINIELQLRSWSNVKFSRIFIFQPFKLKIDKYKLFRYNGMHLQRLILSEKKIARQVVNEARFHFKSVVDNASATLRSVNV